MFFQPPLGIPSGRATPSHKIRIPLPTQYVSIRILTIFAAREQRIRDYGRTAIIIAAQGGHSEVVKILVEADADVNAADKHGITALQPRFKSLLLTTKSKLPICLFKEVLT